MRKYILNILLLTFALTIPTSAALAAGHLLSFQYETPTSAEYAEAKTAIVESGIVDQITAYMNSNLQLPEAVQIVFVNDEEGPYYDSETQRVTIPYAFWVECSDRFSKEYAGELEGNLLDELCGAVMAHTIYHELGHAIISVCELPVTGKEENVVDEFAVLTLFDSFQEGKDMALIAGDYFELEGKEMEEVRDEDLFDEHALDDQRFFTTFCVAYGVLPDDELKKEMLELGMSEDRLELCVDDAERRVQAWTTLLKPFERPQ